MPFESKTKYGTQRDNTELILRTLEGIKRVLQAISAAGPGGDATLAEQLIQTTALGTINTTLDQTVTNKLIEIRDYLANIDQTTFNELGSINNNTVDTVTELQTINTLITATNQLLTNIDSYTYNSMLNTSTIKDYTAYENWDKIVGNSTEYTYVAGILNPAIFLVQTIVYKTGVTTIFTRTFAYDLNDNLTSITAS